MVKKGVEDVVAVEVGVEDEVAVLVAVESALTAVAVRGRDRFAFVGAIVGTVVRCACGRGRVCDRGQRRSRGRVRGRGQRHVPGRGPWRG
jgi:hypothetical protein